MNPTCFSDIIMNSPNPAKFRGSATRSRRQSNGLAKTVRWGCAASLLTIGCLGPKTTEPAWPEQPSPSYPSPTENGDSFLAGSQTQEEVYGSASKGTGASTPRKTLAKEYHQKKALKTLRGQASYYADSLAGNHTANGDIYDPKLFTAAHKKLKFGTIVRVVREDTGAETYVRINDRGPFGPASRIIDLSKVAAKQLDMMKAGVVKVRVEILERPQ